MENAEQIAELLAACALGDKMAFRELYQGVAPRLFAVQLRILKQRTLAEEALQETFLKIWSHAQDYRPERGQPMGWLISIARYQAIDLGRCQPTELHMDDANLFATADSVHESMKSEGNQKLLNHCLERLEAQARRCVVMAYCEGYTHVELSRILETPIGTIKSWIRRSLQRLKDCIDELSRP